MARKPRVAPGGLVYHVLNRAAGKFRFLDREKDFQAYENLLIDEEKGTSKIWCLRSAARRSGVMTELTECDRR